MQTIVPLYGFGGGGGTGATLTVSAPAGAVVTVSKDGKTKTKVAGADGVVVFKGLSTGDWTVNMTSAYGTETMQPKVYHITAGYEIVLTFFAATIHVTYPAGSTCTVTDGVTTLTAPDTSGSWDCVVPNAGTWTVRITDGAQSDAKTVTITENGKIESAWLSYARYIVKDGVLTDIGLSKPMISGRSTTVTQKDGYVYVKNPSTNNTVTGILSGVMIDTTHATRIVASLEIVSAGASGTQSKFNGTGLVLTKSFNYSGLDKAAAGIEHEAISSETGIMTLTIDASSITGEWYVGFAMGGTSKFNIYDLYAE